MVEISLPWDGLAGGGGTGDASISPYNAATEFADILRLVSGSAAKANQGVVFRTLNNLAPASGGTSPATVNTGAAIVYGTVYMNSASVNVAIPTPGGATRVDLIVLRKSWAAQTVRITRVAGTEGAGAPAMTQTLGVTWDIPIATASITTGGVLTVTSTLEFADNLGTTVPSKIKLDVAGAAGTSSSGTHADHVHEVDDPGVPAAIAFNGVGAEGTGVNPARSDHVHALSNKVFRKYKAADTVTNGSIDADLQMTVVNGETYIFEGVVFYDWSIAATELNLQLQTPSGTFYMVANGPDTSVITDPKVWQAASGAFQFGIDSTIRAVIFRGTITFSGNGLFGLLLAGGGNVASIKKFSHIVAFQVN